MKSIPCLLAVVLSVGLTTSALAATPDQIEVNGDIRVREELLSNEGRSADTPNQTRLSVRLGVKGEAEPKGRRSNPICVERGTNHFKL